jgi:hypothetical protein
MPVRAFGGKDEAWAGRCDAFTRVSEHIAALIGVREGAGASVGYGIHRTPRRRECVD